MNLFIEKLYRSFLANAENTCLKIADDHYTYGEVLQVSSGIRQQLKLVDTKNIGIYLTDDVFMYASILAVWFEGKTYVPLHPEFPLSKNLSVVEQAEITTVLSAGEITDDLRVTVINTRIEAQFETTPPIFSDFKDNAYILFTSGSTGNPKGVPIRFSNLYWFADGFEDTFGKINPEDRVLQMFELTFDLSVMSYLIPWLNGASVIALHKNEIKYLQILDLLEANEITVALMVPSILNLIIPYLDENIQNESLRLNLFCGEALLTKQIEKWRNFVPNADLYNVYGPTENTIFCTFHKIEEKIKEQNGIISIGRSMKNSGLSFEEPEASEGELLLSGKLLTEGYWKNPDKNLEAFVSNESGKFYKTGDWCKRDAEGDYFYINRIDFQAKINGFRIELSEIEHFANQKLNDAISVALTKKDKNDNDYLVLYVNDNSCDENEIFSFLKENLPDYAVPSKIICLEQFPLNTSGKIDRHELIKLLQ